MLCNSPVKLTFNQRKYPMSLRLLHNRVIKPYGVVPLFGLLYVSLESLQNTENLIHVILNIIIITIMDTVPIASNIVKLNILI